MRESKNGVKDAETKQSTKLRKQYWDKARHMRKQEQRDAETKQGTWESKEQRDAETETKQGTWVEQSSVMLRQS